MATPLNLNMWKILRHKKPILRRIITCRLCQRSTICSNNHAEVEIGGKPLIIRRSKIAKLADGQAEVQYGNTSVLVTAVGVHAGPSSMVPLRVNYRQKNAASGRIPMNYFRREMGPTERETLTGRIIDRSLRPLLKGLQFDTELVCNVLAMDGENLPDVLAINAASASLALSNIPCFEEDSFVGAVRVGYCDDEFIVNPTRTQLKKSSLDMVLAATQHNIVMIDASANNMPKEKFIAGLKVGLKKAGEVAKSIQDLSQQSSKKKRTVSDSVRLTDAVYNEAYSDFSPQILNVLHDVTHDKMSRHYAIEKVQKEMMKAYKNQMPEEEIDEIFNTIYRNAFRNDIFERKKRCDGRALKELRPISCEVDVYKPLHGSATFTRGQTQVLCTVTFDSKALAFMDNDGYGQTAKEFMLHYEFPSYATNELSAGDIGGAKRRSIGHGALAEKALLPLLPKDLPFAIRLTSEVLESNGSSSMASVCGGSLALMDAGVCLPEPAAGVAVGLVTKDEIDLQKKEKDHGDYLLLADITGLEDGLGDMDFKIAGTQTGITALQVDIKIKGLPWHIAKEAVDLGMTTYINVIKKMNTALSSSRVGKKHNAPLTEKISKKDISIGFHSLRNIRSETGVSVTQNEDGYFDVFAPNKDALDEFKTMIEEKREPELQFGAIYSGIITEIMDSGVKIQLDEYTHPSPFFLHINQLDLRKVEHPSALGMEIGTKISVKYFGRDANDGSPRISRKAMLASIK